MENINQVRYYTNAQGLAGDKTKKVYCHEVVRTIQVAGVKSTKRLGSFECEADDWDYYPHDEKLSIIDLRALADLVDIISDKDNHPEIILT